MRNKINYLKENHTLLLCIFIVIIYLLIPKIIRLKTNLLSSSTGYNLDLLGECIAATVALIILYLVGKIYIIEEKGEGILKGLLVGGVLVFMCFLATYSGFTNILHDKNPKELLPLPQIIIFIATMLGVGLSEEFIFRGIILNLFLDKFSKTPAGIYSAIFLSSILFGAAHIQNVFSGISIEAALVQAVSGAIFGGVFAAIYLRSKNIWVVVILHAFMDLSCLIGSGFFGINSITAQINNCNPMDLLGSIIYIGLIVFLLRKEKMKEILNNLNTSSL